MQVQFDQLPNRSRNSRPQREFYWIGNVIGYRLKVILCLKLDIGFLVIEIGSARGMQLSCLLVGQRQGHFHPSFERDALSLLIYGNRVKAAHHHYTGGLPLNTKYEVQVKALNRAGWSEWSYAVIVSTAPPEQDQRPLSPTRG